MDPEGSSSSCHSFRELHPQLPLLHSKFAFAMTFVSPFGPSTSSPGTGKIAISLLPGNKPIISSLTYQYPLKLVAPTIAAAPSRSHSQHSDQSKDAASNIVTPALTIYLLSYGGGLVAGDQVNLSISLEPHTRLSLLTQGSTKIFKTPDPRQIITRQNLDIKLEKGAGLCYLPDPCQPFADSAFEQRQVFRIHDEDGNMNGGGLCMLDWVSEGRTARGEKWGFWKWAGRNEIYLAPSDDSDAKGRLLLRDAVILDDTPDPTGSSLSVSGSISKKTHGLGVVGTLILHGTLFASLATFFMEQFAAQPRIGGRNWSTGTQSQTNTSDSTTADHTRIDPAAKRKLMLAQIHAQALKDGVIWTAARTRARSNGEGGFVLVKFGASEVEGARRWLGELLKLERSVEREFGEGALLAFR